MNRETAPVILLSLSKWGGQVALGSAMSHSTLAPLRASSTPDRQDFLFLSCPFLKDIGISPPDVMYFAYCPNSAREQTCHLNHYGMVKHFLRIEFHDHRKDLGHQTLVLKSRWIGLVQQLSEWTICVEIRSRVRLKRNSKTCSNAGGNFDNFVDHILYLVTLFNSCSPAQ